MRGIGNLVDVLPTGALGADGCYLDFFGRNGDLGGHRIALLQRTCASLITGTLPAQKL
jgi:hypothetical protein